MRQLVGYVLLLTGVIMTIGAQAANYFENDIRAFEAADRTNPPPTNVNVT